MTKKQIASKIIANKISLAKQGAKICDMGIYGIEDICLISRFRYGVRKILLLEKLYFNEIDEDGVLMNDCFNQDELNRLLLSSL